MLLFKIVVLKTYYNYYYIIIIFIWTFGLVLPSTYHKPSAIVHYTLDTIQFFVRDLSLYGTGTAHPLWMY